MGKKGSWISALKRVFTPTAKDKLVINGLQGPDGDFVKEKKKWALGKLRKGGTRPFIPLHKEPSSIEQILGDAEGAHHKPQQHYHDPPPRAQRRSAAGNTTPARAQPEQPKAPALAAAPEGARRPSSTENNKLGSAAPEQRRSPAAGRGAQQPRMAARSSAVSPSRMGVSHVERSAVKIQAAFRGYAARRSYRALRALVRLQRVMRGQSVKRQTASALKLMQLFVRVQYQVRMGRIQAMESKTPPQQAHRISEREQESNISRWSFSHESEAEQAQSDWDGSLLTKEEIEARMHRKVEAIVKRERTLAYASTHEQLKVPPKSPRSALSELRSGGTPVWWSWLERHLRPHQNAERATTPPARARTPTTPRNWAPPYVQTRPGSRNRQSRLVLENPETCTPRSSSHTLAAAAARNMSRNRAAGVRPTPRDDESLTSCPVFAVVPGYMAPTLSARAKVREQAFHRDGPPPAAAVKRRFSFGLSQSIGTGTLRWGKGSLFAPKEMAAQPQRPRGKHRPMHSVGDLSVDSAASLPLGAGRRSFK